jgi:hypothetical protein
LHYHGESIIDLLRQQLRINYMPPKTIKEMVGDSFRDHDSREYAKEYLSCISSNNQFLETETRRSLIRSFLLFGLFFLLIGASVEEVTLGPIKIKDISIIEKFLPLLVAVNYYELISLIIMRRLFLETEGRMVEILSKNIYKNDLETFLFPNSIPLWSEKIFEKSYEGIVYKINDNINLFISLIIFLGAFLFEGYAFYMCFVLFGVSDIILWSVLIVSVLFLLKGFLTFWEMDKLYLTRDL